MTILKQIDRLEGERLMTPSFLFLLLSHCARCGPGPHRPPGRRRESRLRLGNLLHRFARTNSNSQKPCVATIEKPGFAPKTVALTAAKDKPKSRSRSRSLSDRVLVTATGLPSRSKKRASRPNVFTANDFEAPPVSIRRRTCCATSPALRRADRPQRRTHQSVRARRRLATQPWCCSMASRSPSPGAIMDFAHLTSDRSRSHGSDSRPGKRALSVRRRRAP